jgi:hypothetical protein
MEGKCCPGYGLDVLARIANAHVHTGSCYTPSTLWLCNLRQERVDQGSHEVSACVVEPIVPSTVREIRRRRGLRVDDILYIMIPGEGSGRSGDDSCRVVLCQQPFGCGHAMRRVRSATQHRRGCLRLPIPGTATAVWWLRIGKV